MGETKTLMERNGGQCPKMGEIDAVGVRFADSS